MSTENIMLFLKNHLLYHLAQKISTKEISNVAKVEVLRGSARISGSRCWDAEAAAGGLLCTFSVMWWQVPLFNKSPQRTGRCPGCTRHPFALRRLLMRRGSSPFPEGSDQGQPMEPAGGASRASIRRQETEGKWVCFLHGNKRRPRSVGWNVE